MPGLPSARKPADRALTEKASRLSRRQMEVLKLIAEGRSNREIARRLGIGARTVETHREQLMNKLDIRGIAGLTRFALESGLADYRAP